MVSFYKLVTKDRKYPFLLLQLRTKKVCNSWNPSISTNMFLHPLTFPSVWLQSYSSFHFSDNVYLNIKCNACVCQCTHIVYAAVWSVINEPPTCKLARYLTFCCAQTQFSKIFTPRSFQKSMRQLNTITAYLTPSPFRMKADCTLSGSNFTVRRNTVLPCWIYCMCLPT